MAIINDKSKITPFVAGILVTLAITGWGALLLSQNAPSVDIPDPPMVDNTNNTQTNNTNITTPTNNTKPTNQTNNPPVSNALPQVNISSVKFQQLVNPRIGPWEYRQCFINCTITKTYYMPVDIVYEVVNDGDGAYVRHDYDGLTSIFYTHPMYELNKDAFKLNFTQVAHAKLYIYFVDSETHKYVSGIYVMDLTYTGENILPSQLSLDTNLESLTGKVAF